MKIYNFILSLYFISILISSCWSSKEISEELNTTKEMLIIEKEIDLKEIKYENQIFNNKIKSVVCNKNKLDLSLPIINLSSNDVLTIHFDDLDGDRKDYYYNIIHCNSNWEKSDLIESEYLDGFYTNSISDYEFSFNTVQKYTHYMFEFPNQNVKPKVSGNYIFQIFEENKNIVLTKRFMVLDNKVVIDSKIRRATLADFRATRHEIDFSINYNNVNIADPYSEITVHIKQNNSEENIITDLHPLFVKNQKLIYDYESENTFLGNNEFRHFDFSSLRYQSDRISEIKFDSINNVYLFNDHKRTFNQYSIEPDINGNFLIRTQEGWNPNNEADYAYVHFTLEIEEISNQEIYLLGSFSDWKLDKEFKLLYNKETQKYETRLLLKQGYYNYQYALSNNDAKENINFIEGNHYQTRNDYYIYVYYRPVGARYDQLVGYSKSSSKELF